jgi:predicted nucleotidyltransferase
LGSVRHDAAVTDDEFVERVVAACRQVPNVQAIALGGSRARGDHRADSDWDFAVYYRGDIDVSVFDQFGWRGHREARTRHREPA